MNINLTVKATLAKSGTVMGLKDTYLMWNGSLKIIYIGEQQKKYHNTSINITETSHLTEVNTEYTNNLFLAVIKWLSFFKWLVFPPNFIKNKFKQFKFCKVLNLLWEKRPIFHILTRDLLTNVLWFFLKKKIFFGLLCLIYPPISR